MTTISNNAIVSDKNTLLTTPMKPNRYLIVEETRELYYDTDNAERIKVRDIQLIAKDSDRLNAKAFSQDLYFVLETNQLWFYNVVADPEHEGQFIGEWNFAHPVSGVTEGTYTMVVTDKYGHVTQGLNPTTLEEYNLTDDTKKLIAELTDSELSLESANSVQNKVITTKLNQIQEDMNNSIRLEVDNEGTLYFPTTFGTIENETIFL